MKTINNIWKRLFSLALALIMVLGYVPAEVFAEETDTEKPTGLWSASVQTVEKEIIPETTAPTEPAETEDPEATGVVTVDVPVPVYKYHHTVTVKDAEGNPVTEGVSVKGIDENAENEKSVTVDVTYKGMTLTVSSGKTEYWNASATWGSITAGAALPAHSHTDNGLAAEDGAKWTTVYKEVKKGEGGDVEEEIALKDGDIVDSSLIGHTLKAVSTLTYNGEVLMTLTNENTVGYAVATYSCSHAGGWYTEMPTVTLTAETAVTDPACLEPVTVTVNNEEEPTTAKWIKETEGSKITCEVPAAEGELTKVIKVGSLEVKLDVDHVAPEISGVSAVEQNGDKVVVYFTYTVGASGGKLNVAGKEIEVAEGKNISDSETIDKPEGDVVVTLVSNAIGSEPVQASASIVPLPQFKVEGIVAEKDGVSYIHTKNELKVTAENLNYPNTIWTLKIGEVDVEDDAYIVSDDGKTITVHVGKLPVGENGLVNGLLINVTDGNQGGRDCSKTWDIGFDTEQPDVELTVFKGTDEIVPPPAAGDVLPHEVTYKLTMTDNIAVGGGKAIFYVNEKAMDPIDFVDGVASYTVQNGQYLTSITYSAYDAAGNPAPTKQFEPKVKVDTVDPIVEVVEFKISAAPNQVETGSKYLGFKGTSGEVTAELKVKLIEENPNTTSLNDADWKAETDSEGRVTWYKTVTVTVEAGDHAQLDVAELNVTDLAGRKPAAGIAVEVGAKNGKTYTISFSPKNGEFEGGILINNNDPDCEKPDAQLELTLKPTSDSEGKPITTRNGLPVYNKEFTINVSDASGVTIDSWDAGNGTAVLSEGAIKVTPPTEQDLEKDVVTLYASTSTTADEVNFAIDTLAPSVSVQVDNGETYDGDVNHYYSEPVTLTFTVKDLLAAEATISYQIDDGDVQTLTVTKELGEDSKSGSFTVPENKKLTALSVIAKDELGNTSKEFTGYTFAPIVVDGTDPVPSIEIQVTDSDGGKLAQTVEGVEYYDGLITIVASAKDVNALSATLTCKINGETPPYKAEFAPNEVGWSFSLPVNEGDKITDISLTAVDKSGRTVTKNYVDNENNAISIVVDKKPPEITVKQTVAKEKKYIQTFNGKDYYNGAVTYTFTVVDKYLDTKNTKVEVSYEGESEPKTLYFAPVEGKVDTYSVTEIVTNDKTMTGYTVTAVDYAKHEVTEEYTGNPVVVDTEAPTAVLEITGEVETYYSRIVVEKEDEKEVEKEYFFVKLKTPVDDEADAENKHKEMEKITATITIVDKEGNLTTDIVDKVGNHNAYPVKGNGITPTEGAGVVKEVTYTNSIEVAVDETQTLVIDLTAFDLAGNALADLTVNAADNSTTLPINAVEGVVKADLVIDRRRPTTEAEDKKPQIIISMPPESKLKSSAGFTLYTEAVQFDILVKDGTEDSKDKNAGLKSVAWWIEDKHPDANMTFLDAGSVTAPNGATFEFGDAKMDYQITHTAGEGAGETNHATLTVIAIDNMGNKITKSVDFAIDTEAPRVSGDYTPAKSDKENEYFNEKRFLKITVDDINFMPEMTGVPTATLSTSGAYGEWEGTNGKYTLDVSFTTEGKHNFGIQLDDVTGKHPVDTADVKFNSEYATEFVLDWTAPKITVGYDPANHSGIDPQGVLYYNQRLKATVYVEEINFDSSDVQTEGISLTFGDANEKNVQSASAWFEENNNYKFSVNCTDLAGNPAEKAYTSPTFSVDLTAPTIEMTRGNLNLNEMNVIQEDLELAFTINDAQHNLSDYNVTVYHLNNTFQRTAVSGAEYYTVSTQENRTTVLVNFATIEALKKNDGIYTVEITAVDYAGNTVRLTPDLTISLNRFGSTFTTNDKFTTEFLTTGSDGNAYHSTIDNKLVIQEINPNRVWQDSSKKTEGSVLTVVVNGTATQLTAGKEYDMTVTQEGSGDNKWFVYTYEIDPDTFKEGGNVVDGRYTVMIYGEDDAGNKNTNESNEYGAIQLNAAGEYSGRIEFVLDATAPIITTTGIESGKTYNAEFQRLDIYLSDNTPADIAVYLNDALIPVAESAVGLADTEAWLVYNADIGAYTLNVPEQNTLFNGQSIRIVATDAAGNEAEYSIEDFNVSTNLFVRLLNNAWFIGGTATALVLALILLILKKKKGVAQSA